MSLFIYSDKSDFNILIANSPDAKAIGPKNRVKPFWFYLTGLGILISLILVGIFGFKWVIKRIESKKVKK